jgi:3-hydroxybutyryl-CoA dehydrogenase
MQVIVLTNESLKEELLSNVASVSEEIIWIETISQLQDHPNADAFIDLLFEKEHTSILQNLLPKTVIISSVEETLTAINSSFVRINAWPTFLKSTIVEASSLNEDRKKKAEEIFSLFNKKLEWLPDQIGFITPRVISMIINEAFISLKEGVSTKEEIDTAMKLGTNYPYGPFEWCEKIGTKKIASLLQQLNKENSRYTSFMFLLK